MKGNRIVLPNKTAVTRLLRATVIVGVAAGSMLVGVSPASAHGSKTSTSMTMGNVNQLSQGAKRTIPAGHLHNVSWGFSSFPSGGRVNVRVRFLVRPASGDCSQAETIRSDGALHVFSNTATQVLATEILPGTCYRLIWRPTNSAAANRTLPGTLVISDFE